VNQQTESRKRCNHRVWAVIAGSVKIRVGIGKARKVIELIIINQPAGILHMLTFVAAADIESASPPMMLFLFCFARVLAKLLLRISHESSPPSPCRPRALSKKERRPNTQTNNHPVYYCCIFLLLLLLGSLSTTNSPIHALQASRISAVPFGSCFGFYVVAASGFFFGFCLFA
jgi:hypothetical protein